MRDSQRHWHYVLLYGKYLQTNQLTTEVIHLMQTTTNKNPGYKPGVESLTINNSELASQVVKEVFHPFKEAL